MIENLKAVRITGIFHRNLTPIITQALESAGVKEYQAVAGRWIALREREGFLGIPAKAKINDNPVDLIHILVNPELERSVLHCIIRNGGIATPGRGTVYSEDVVVYKAHHLCHPLDKGPPVSKPVRLQKELTGICCIVQRGEGDEVARVALDTGTCVPAITYGHGTGVRDKLGLLRITIPAEKEVITISASSYDAEAIMDLMITEGKLNQPGKGFVYLYPIRSGMINMKVIQGMPKHAASMEQIIVAIDEIHGGTSWRARGGSVGLSSLEGRHYIHDLISLSYTCNEGFGDKLIQEAMKTGVPGATMYRLKHVYINDKDTDKLSPARENWNMIIEKNQLESAVKVMEEQGALDDHTQGQFCYSPVPKAYTYI